MHEPVSTILMAYNEVEVIEKVIRDNYDNVVAKIPGSELIIAEDGSTDGTTEVIQRLSREIPLQHVSSKERKGYIPAYRDALQLGKCNLIFFSDASGKHKAEDFWRLNQMIGNADVVIGYKENRQDPAYRLVMTRIFNGLTNSYFRVDFHDINCGFRLMRRNAITTVAKEKWLFRDLINTEITLRMHYHGFVVKEAPVQHLPRLTGPSRGLPIQIIPKVIARTLNRLPKLKSEITAPDYRSVPR